MKAKNLFLTALFVATGILCVNSAKAADVESKTGTIKLNLKLYPIHSIVINPGNSTDGVLLEYKNRNDYLSSTENNTIQVANQLTVFSTSGYIINVKADESGFNALPDGVIAPGLNTISLQAKKTDGSYDGSSIKLLKTDLPLFESDDATGGNGTNIDITYAGATQNAYFQAQHFSSTDPSAISTFTTTLTYTLVAK
ncbi:hypothetical protein [Parabacteroides sp. Marseille-P3160]|uniref:hypothetical protein n=1 Tax=Parabacteroides sp. Marseille-P3160 TaxID=1917887 RepID=UPI0009BA847B|nr:hypothetical protein [Parabacteroides sp. Marseille-P3160]